MPATTAKGAPYPVPGDNNNVPADLQALAGWVDARPGVSPLSTAQRDALGGADLWDGRLIWNTTTAQIERYSGGAWGPTGSALVYGAVTAQTSFGLAASNGAATTVARSDHSHGTPATPSAASVGALPVTGGTVSGPLYVSTNVPTTGAAATAMPLRVSDRGGFGGVGGGTGNLTVSDNIYWDGTNWRFQTTATNRSSFVQLSDGSLTFQTAPAGAAGAVAVMATRFLVSNGGMVQATSTVQGASHNLTGAWRSDQNVQPHLVIGTTIDVTGITATTAASMLRFQGPGVLHGDIGWHPTESGGTWHFLYTGGNYTQNQWAALKAGAIYDGGNRVYSASNPPPVSGMTVLGTTGPSPVGATAFTAAFSFVAPPSGRVVVSGMSKTSSPHTCYVNLDGSTLYLLYFQPSGGAYLMGSTGFSGLSPGATYTVYYQNNGLSTSLWAEG